MAAPRRQPPVPLDPPGAPAVSVSDLLYLVVVLDEKYDIWEIREFHLDAAAAEYRLYAVHGSVLELEQPIRLKLPISDLVSG